MIAARFLAIGALGLAMALAGGTVSAQAPPEGHEQHHPAGDAPSPAAPAPGGSAPSAPPGAPPATLQPSPPAPAAPPMDMGQMMRQMERMMGGSVNRPLFPRLLDAERLTESDRAALREDAERRIQQGLTLLDRGVRDLAAARGAGDEAAIERALGSLGEGAEQWEAGTAVRRALSLPAATASTAAGRWFRSQLHIEVPAVISAWPWGLSPVHLGVMAILAVTAGGGVLLYLYKVRRSLALLARVTRDPRP